MAIAIQKLDKTSIFLNDMVAILFFYTKNLDQKSNFPLA
jgi:hypothetical protein